VKTSYEERVLHFNHSAEVSTASYYSVYLQDREQKNEIFAEQSGKSRAGIWRVTFPKDSTPYSSIQVTRKGYDGSVTIDPIRREIYGWNPEREDSNLGPDKAASFKGYFVARFEESFDSFGIAHNDSLQYNVTEATGELLSAFVQFSSDISQIHVKMGISYISIEQARYNLDNEIPDGKNLEDVSEETWNLWSEKMDLVKLYNSTDDQNIMFYSAMFHALQFPNEMYEESLNGDGFIYYSGYDDQIHSGKAYTSYSLWDTFRAEWGFFNLFAPERINEMITSMLQVYEQSGRLPMWQNIVETNIMIGTHSASLIAESLKKGFTGFNTTLAWEAVYKDAMIPPDNDTTIAYYDRQQGVGYEARAGLTTYMANGWVAAGKTSEAGSRTLEYAYDDYAVAMIAQMTNQPKEMMDYFLQRSQNYRLLWDNSTGFMCARNQDGSWNTGGGTWTEASNWVYTFNVQHDFAGLRELFGSAELLANKLNAYFNDHHNLHPNEPSHATAYAFYYGNAPDRAQDQLRHILRLNYHPSAFGLSGEDDCGQMSAWYVFNALGFYPVNPASGDYMIGSPIFDKVEIKLLQAGGQILTITAEGAKDRVYVERLRINGRLWNKPIISHADLLSMKEMDFTMNHRPQPFFQNSV
jgi:predicted alpha-1,2-mannosidase